MRLQWRFLPVGSWSPSRGWGCGYSALLPAHISLRKTEKHRCWNDSPELIHTHLPGLKLIDDDYHPSFYSVWRLYSNRGLYSYFCSHTVWPQVTWKTHKYHVVMGQSNVLPKQNALKHWIQSYHPLGFSSQGLLVQHWLEERGKKIKSKLKT